MLENFVQGKHTAEIGTRELQKKCDGRDYDLQIRIVLKFRVTVWYDIVKHGLDMNKLLISTEL